MVYRELSQVSRALKGQAQLVEEKMNVKEEPQHSAPNRPSLPPGDTYVSMPPDEVQLPAGAGGVTPRGMSTPALLKEIGVELSHLARQQVELGLSEFKADVKKEMGVAAGLGAAGIATLMVGNLLLVAAALALSQWLPAWIAALIMAGFVAVVGGLIGSVAWMKRVRVPLARTRQMVREDVEWTKEKLA